MDIDTIAAGDIKNGFVFNTVHNIRANVPVENIVAMINDVKDFN
ncbi:hypothetical protein AQPE_4419 [Aquipluma nitroreducens]|uniref:Uncharacterized protein n=1 Tax=Aquipluma nitroreducens TaxID=2010828 RepID=A0A5K7SF64_9BACT|nr:hypothetical protein [Aquipluma nitroreducens]BBE20228.1 hypothetical protein AQPE_4419 [Aquipluma nitroreducens]